MSHEHRREVLVAKLSEEARRGQSYCASELTELTGIKKALIRRALTVNADQLTPVPGVRIEKSQKPGGRLAGAGFWFSWVGTS